MKTIFYRLKIGIIKGFETPNLPMHIIKLQLHPLIRIFRVLSGISLLLILTKKIYNFHEVFLYLAVFNSIMFFVYHLYISYYRIKHIKSIIKNKDLEIRNSPLDKFQTIFKLTINSLKTINNTTVGTDFTVALMYELDDILVEEGKSRYFVPAIKNKLNELQLKESIDSALKRLGIEELDLNRESIKNINLTQLNENSKKEFESETGINVVEAQKIYNYIMENRKKLEFKNEIDQLIKKDPFSKN